jgi:outer membrane protein assembly factor BamB
LLEAWPENGPELLWKANGLGIGYSSVSVAGGRLYTMGDGETVSHVHCIDIKDGKIAWSSKPIGKTGGDYEGTRGTPTLDGNHLYALGQFGDLVCLKMETGEEVWRKNLVTDFGGRPGKWNYSESPLIDEGKVIVTTGSKEGSIVALDKMTGALVWKSKDFIDEAQYSSLILRDFGGKKQYVQFTLASVVGLEASTGKVLWKAARKGRTATVSTPIFHEGQVFVSSSYGAGCNGFKVSHSDGTFSIEEIYSNKNISNDHGGCIRVGDHIYGSSSTTMVCMDFKTGERKWRARSAGKGSILIVDDKIILRAESGTLALLELNPDAYTEISRFDQPDRSKAKAWAHPVVSNGILYLRDQGLLLAYDLRKK